jgi:hypothetical protein
LPSNSVIFQPSAWPADIAASAISAQLAEIWPQEITQTLLPVAAFGPLVGGGLNVPLYPASSSAVTAAGTPLELVLAAALEAGVDAGEALDDEAELEDELEDELEQAAIIMSAATSAAAAAAIRGSRAA